MTDKLDIGILKIGANVTMSGSIQTASNFDLFSLAPILTNAGHTVRIFTRITRNTKINKPYKLHDYMKVKSLDKLDALLVFNGPINFFGGKEDPGIIHQWELINAYKGTIYYVMTDSRYPFLQLWELMILKDWHIKYDREKIWVTRDDIHYIYQGRDREALMMLINRRTRNVRVDIDNIHPFPVDWAIMLDPPEMLDDPIESRRYDLIYGGSNRDAKRKNKFHEYYHNEECNTLTFGSIKFEVDLPSNVKKIPQVPHKQFIRKMSEGKSTVIIGDKHYQNNFFTLRIYESILAGCLTFIDIDFDPEQRLYKGNNLLTKWMYVDGFNDYQTKMREILDFNLGDDIVSNQLDHIENYYDKRDYEQRLIDIISKKD